MYITDMGVYDGEVRSCSTSGQYWVKLNKLCVRSVLLTERRVVWSLRCPQSSLLVGVGEVEEGAKAGMVFPPEVPPPLGALLLGCLRKPTAKKEKQRNRTDLKVKHGKEVQMEYGEGRNTGRGEGENMRGVKGEGRR